MLCPELCLTSSDLGLRAPSRRVASCLRWRGNLVQERHGDQPQAARAISSQTPMWWTANGVYWWVGQHYIAWVYSITSVCLRHRLNTIGYPERGPIFPYSATSSDRQALTIHTLQPASSFKANFSGWYTKAKPVFFLKLHLNKLNFSKMVSGDKKA